MSALMGEGGGVKECLASCMNSSNMLLEMQIRGRGVNIPKDFVADVVYEWSLRNVNFMQRHS